MLCHKGRRGWRSWLWSGEEVSRGHVKGASNAGEVAEFRVVLATLYALKGRAVDACAFGQLLLGEVGVEAGVADSQPERLLGADDPFGLVGGHASHGLPFMIICQQLLCGFL